MALDALTAFPNEFTAGDTLLIERSLTNYPASDGWTLKYSLVASDGSTNASIVLTSTESGDEHHFTVAKATTAAYPAGKYKLTEYAESTTERIQLSVRFVSILPNPATATGTSASFAAQVLKNLRDAYKALTAGGLKTSSASVNGKSYSRSNLIELRDDIAYWQNVVNREERTAQGLGPWQQYQVRM